MSISLNANFELLSAGLYLDARQQFNTIIEMKDFAETSIPDGFITYNKETQKHYVFNSSNTVDATLGKWREYEGSNTSLAINFWQPNTDYKVNDLCLYKETNYYSVYICTADHTSADTFVSAYWETIDGTEFEGYTEDELLDMLNLSEEELQNLQNIINDNEVQTDHVWSSSKVYAELLTTLSESKNFTIAEIAKIVSFSYKVVSSEDDVIDDKAIYLIENSSGTHDMYLLVDGSPSKVGNTSIDLSDYLKKEDIVDTFDGTTIYTDSDKVFSTKASKSMYDDLNDKKISKSAIVTTLDDTVTDEQVPSALLTKTELDKTNAKLGDKADKSYVDDNFATMDKVNALHKATTGVIKGSLLGSVVKDANLYYQKFGDNRLVINGWVSVDAVSTKTPIFTLPNNWKANSNYLLPCYMVNSNVACACLIDINNGTVNSYTPLPATLELRFCGEIYLM